MTGKPPWWEIALRVVALLTGLGLALFASILGMVFLADDPDANGVVFLVRFAPGIALLFGALLALVRPRWLMIAVFVAGVLAMLNGFGGFSFVLFFPALFLVPGVIAEQVRT